MIQLHNTLTGAKDQFKVVDNRVGIYSCGLTVYSHPHIGNWTYFIFCDVLQRTLIHAGMHVTRVQNITDVGHLSDDADAGEDKMLKGALKDGLNAWQVAEKYIKIADHEAFGMLKLLRPDHMPRATDYIPQQIKFVQELDNAGFVYELADGLYFDTSKLHDYGRLARLNIEGLRFGARVKDTGKKNQTDFAVWKFSTPSVTRDMEWESPWGTGFPGWHLECSVMAKELLGETIDIHTGGIDHIPVHHTNEIAQTEALTGKPMSRFWLHANHLKVNGTKISKSLGNVYTLQDIVDRGFSLDGFKLLVLSKHYSSEGNFDWDILGSAENRLRNWRTAATLRHQNIPMTDAYTQETDYMVAATDLADRLEDNLDTPGALALIDAVLSNVAISGSNADQRSMLSGYLTTIESLLGIDLIDSTPDITDEQKHRLETRTRARNNRDWATSDKLRDTFEREGIILNDTSSGTTWSYR